MLRSSATRSLAWLNLENALYFSIGLIAILLRIWDVGLRAMHGDEAEHAWFAWNLYSGAGYHYDPVYHGPLQFLVTAAFFFLFGVSETVARLMAVLFGAALVFLPYFLRSYLGKTTALVASAFIAISPAFVYVSRLERDDIFTCFFAFTMALALWGLARTGRPRFLYLGAASAALSLSAMENTYITLFIFGTFLVIALLSETLAFKWPEPARRFTFVLGSGPTVSFASIGIVALLLILALALTIATGLYPPLPALLVIFVVILVGRQVTLQTLQTGERPFTGAFTGLSRTHWFNALTIVAAILVLCYSVFGSELRGIWDSAQPLLNTNGRCALNHFPLNPCRQDILGGLFYWLSQHQVHRGGQPWYYYSLLFGLYEQIAVLFGVGGIMWFLRRPTPFSAFVTYWAVLSFGIYSWAGEKFPWLMIHPLLPFTLLAAMFIVDAVQHYGRKLWILLVLLGSLLLAVELHNMYEVNFVNGADPVEMMVYVQSAPDTPAVARQVLQLSNKVTNGMSMKVTIDAQDSWPFAWYLRDMPNVAYASPSQVVTKPYSTNPVIIVDRADQSALHPKIKGTYAGRLHVLRWWFPEDYKTWSWGDFAAKAINPGSWWEIAQWALQRRPFGPKGAVWFYYYVRHGLASPF